MLPRTNMLACHPRFTLLTAVGVCHGALRATPFFSLIIDRDALALLYSGVVRGPRQGVFFLPSVVDAAPADVAQLAEQRFCKPPVGCSSPFVGSIRWGGRVVNGTGL